MLPGTLNIYRSNRAERLADALADVVSRTRENPLTPETLVVQGRGMEVWLNQQLSSRLGVFAGAEFLYPRNFLGQVASLVLGAPEDEASLLGQARERLLWSLLKTLPQVIDRPELKTLQGYVGDDEDGIRSLQLVTRIADRFDQYLLFRPDIVRAWGQTDIEIESGPDDWQPFLWRALPESLRSAHLAAREPELIRTLMSQDTPFLGLAPRVSLFGLSSLAPLYVRVLAALSRHTEINLFLLAPSPHFWADLCVPQKDSESVQTALGPGASLVASLGRLGAELQTVLTSELETLGVADHEPQPELFATPEGGTLLETIQRQLSSLDTDEAAPILELHPEDHSVSVHSCHGPMREVEVLHDQLLELMTRPVAPVEPQDILVMTPDIEAYAPLIEAVFERGREDVRHIPYRIADRSIRNTSPAVDGFRRLLGLVGSRWTASSVLDLLELEPVRRRFDIEAGELEQLGTWIRESGVRWGIDARHRESHGQPAYHANTWRFGLERLLLGYALPGGGVTLYAGALPYDEVEGSQATLVGKLSRYVETLIGVLGGLATPRSMDEWRQSLTTAADQLLLPDADGGWEVARITSGLSHLAELAAETGFDEPLSLDVTRDLLDQQLDDAHPARGFLSGGVTFCAMVPMRSIPFRVVALLGLADGVFPRSDRPLDFDLIAKRPRPGDRSRRADDRYLFLEALLSARERLIITYTGQSIRDNSPKPPSVVVSEFLEQLSRSTAGGDAERSPETLEHQLVTRHPLQPFSARYFDGEDPNLFSYAGELAAGARAAEGGVRRAAPPLFSESLPPAEELKPGMGGRATLRLGELSAFFQHPARYLMQRRLGLSLREDDNEQLDREPIELDPLEKFQVGDTMLQLELGGVSGSAALELLRAGGRVPLGTPGECTHGELALLTQTMADHVQRERDGHEARSLPIDLEPGEHWRLLGDLTQLHGRRLVRHQFSRVRASHRARLWIEHLALCSALPGEPVESVLIGRAKLGLQMTQTRFSAVARPAELLLSLVELLPVGLREPLALIPEASETYLQALRHPTREASPEDTRLAALHRATKALEKARGFDEHLVRAYPEGWDIGSEPSFAGALGPSFEELAARFFGPLMDHLVEGEA